jgi:hypothetical protein
VIGLHEAVNTTPLSNHIHLPPFQPQNEGAKEKKAYDRSLAGTKKREPARKAASLMEWRRAKNKMAERSGFEPEVEVYAPTLA